MSSIYLRCTKPTNVPTRYATASISTKFPSRSGPFRQCELQRGSKTSWCTDPRIATTRALVAEEQHRYVGRIALFVRNGNRASAGSDGRYRERGALYAVRRGRRSSDGLRGRIDRCAVIVAGNGGDVARKLCE